VSANLPPTPGEMYESPSCGADPVLNCAVQGKNVDAPLDRLGRRRLPASETASPEIGSNQEGREGSGAFILFIVCLVLATALLVFDLIRL
jgi:hypothetical protein